jgi:hypothetical protein
VKFSRFQLNKFFASLNFSYYTLENFVLFESLGGPELQRLRTSLNTENYISEKVPPTKRSGLNFQNFSRLLNLADYTMVALF